MDNSTCVPVIEGFADQIFVIAKYASFRFASGLRLATQLLAAFGFDARLTGRALPNAIPSYHGNYRFGRDLPPQTGAPDTDDARRDHAQHQQGVSREARWCPWL